MNKRQAAFNSSWQRSAFIVSNSGGDGRIRTCDRLLTYNGLANRRLQPLGHISARLWLNQSELRFSASPAGLSSEVVSNRERHERLPAWINESFNDAPSGDCRKRIIGLCERVAFELKLGPAAPAHGV